MAELRALPCRGRCEWQPDPRPTQPPRFQCRGCGSQWDRSLVWRPREADGSVSAEVAAEADRRPR